MSDRPTASDLQTAAMRGSIWTSAGSVLSLPLAFIANIVVARALGPVELGRLATLMAAYVIATTVANAGISDATLQWGAGAFARGSVPEMTGLTRRCSGYHAVVETPLIVVATLIFLHGASWPTRIVASVAAAVTMLLGTATIVHTFSSRTATLARVGLAGSVATQVVAICTALASHSGAATWAGRIAAASIGPAILVILLPRGFQRAVLRPLSPTGWPRGFKPYAIKAAGGTIASMLVFSRSEIFVLNAHHLAVAAGIYALAFGLAAHITAPVDSVLGPMLPAAASLAAERPERLTDALLRGIRFTAFSAGATAALAIPTVAALTGLIYGSSFTTAGELLLPMGLVSCIQSLNHPVTAFMYGTRRVGATLLINVGAFSIDIAIAVLTIGALGVWGAAMANAAGQLVSLAGTSLVLARGLRVSLSGLLRASLPFAHGSIAALCGWLIAVHLHFLELPAELRAVIGFTVGFVIFAAFQRVGRPPLEPEDLELLWRGLPAVLRRPTRIALALMGAGS